MKRTKVLSMQIEELQKTIVDLRMRIEKLEYRALHPFTFEMASKEDVRKERKRPEPKVPKHLEFMRDGLEQATLNRRG